MYMPTKLRLDGFLSFGNALNNKGTCNLDIDIGSKEGLKENSFIRFFAIRKPMINTIPN